MCGQRYTPEFQDEAVRQVIGRCYAVGEFALPTGHITAVAYLFYLRSRVLKFFDRKLAENNSGGTAAVVAGSCENGVSAR